MLYLRNRKLFNINIIKILKCLLNINFMINLDFVILNIYSLNINIYVLILILATLMNILKNNLISLLIHWYLTNFLELDLILLIRNRLLLILDLKNLTNLPLYFLFCTGLFECIKLINELFNL